MNQWAVSGLIVWLAAGWIAGLAVGAISYKIVKGNKSYNEAMNWGDKFVVGLWFFFGWLLAPAVVVCAIIAGLAMAAGQAIEWAGKRL